MMAKVLKTLTELREIRAVLDKHGHPAFKLSPLGVIRSTLCRYWAYEAVVDQWPNFHALILRPNKDELKEYNFRYTDVYLYGVDPSKMEKLLQQPDILPWHENFCIPSCSVDLKDIVERESEKHGGKIEHSPELYEAYVPRDPQAIKAMKIPTAQYTFGRLHEEHAELVFKQWGSPRQLGKQLAIPYITDLIRNHPSACAYDKQGHPVSWALMEYEGCGGFAYTVPEHRGKRVYNLVGVHIAQQAYSQGFECTFAYGAVSNKQIQKAVDKMWNRPVGYLWFGRYAAHCSAAKL